MEQRDNSGALFKNEKRTNDNQPHYRGDAMVNGKAMRIAAWVKTSKNGVTYMSLQFEEPFQQQGNSPQPPQSLTNAPKADGAEQSPSPQDDGLPF